MSYAPKQHKKKETTDIQNKFSSQKVSKTYKEQKRVSTLPSQTRTKTLGEMFVTCSRVSTCALRNPVTFGAFDIFKTTSPSGACNFCMFFWLTDCNSLRSPSQKNSVASQPDSHVGETCGKPVDVAGGFLKQ